MRGSIGAPFVVAPETVLGFLRGVSFLVDGFRRAVSVALGLTWGDAADAAADDVADDAGERGELGFFLTGVFDVPPSVPDGADCVEDVVSAGEEDSSPEDH